MLKFSIIYMDRSNRMARIGFGKKDSSWFFRIDFWFFGVRILPTLRPWFVKTEDGRKHVT